MSEPKKRTRKKNTSVPSLSSTELQSSVEEPSLGEIREKVFSSLNNLELEKALDVWLKKNYQDNKVVMRDLTILKSIITEYLDAYILFGYSTQGDRTIIQHFKNAKDRDAMMEFLKTIFLKQQHENFLDIDEEDN
jgi:hypothetical protein